MAGGAIVLSGAGGAAAAAAAAYLTYGGTAAALLGTVAKQTAQRLTQNKYHPYTGCFRSYSCYCPFPCCWYFFVYHDYLLLQKKTTFPRTFSGSVPTWFSWEPS